MNCKFLENTGLIFVKVDFDDNIISVQKDEFFDFDFTDLNELLSLDEWLKSYKYVKNKRQNHAGRPVKIGKKWVKMDIFARENTIDIKIDNVSKIQSERLIILREIARKLYAIATPILSLIVAVTFLIIAVKSYFDYQLQENKQKDLMLAQELKNERTKWFERMQKQDSVLIAQTELLQTINSNLQNTQEQNKIIADLTRFYKSAEEQNLALLTDFTVLEYLHPERVGQLTEIKKFHLSERYQEIKDSLENERDRKHKVSQFRFRKEF